jgi:hypothetical protein
MKNSKVTLLIILFLCLLSAIDICESQTSSSYAPDYHFKVNDSDFFPIGWHAPVYAAAYNPDDRAFLQAKTREDLNTIKNSGATVVLNTWYCVCEYFSDGPDTPANYIQTLPTYLQYLNSLGLKAIIDMGTSPYYTPLVSAFTIDEMKQVAETVKNNPAVFAYWLFDEAECGLIKDGWPTPDSLQTIANAIRSIDKTHPLIPILGDPKFFQDYQNASNPPDPPNPQPFYSTSYDALAWDSYVFGTGHDSALNAIPRGCSDFNDVARLVSRRGVAQTKALNKLGFILWAQGEDSYPDPSSDQRAMTDHDVKYETISPIIQGARGIVYAYWNLGTSSSQSKVNSVIRFIRNNNIDKVVMSDTILDSLVSLANFKKDGQTLSPNDYVWKKYSYCTGMIDPDNDNFKMFNYIARKYDGSYYLLVANDFSSTIQTDFVLDNIIGTNESVYQIEELNVNGTASQKNFNNGSSLHSCSFNDVFLGYDTKVYKIDVFAWSPTYSMDGVAWETSGGGIAVADFNNNGKKDFAVMTMDDGPAGPNNFRFKIGWDIETNANGTVSFNDNSWRNFPGLGRGEMNAISWETSGGGIAAYDIDGNDNMELFFMGINKVTNGLDEFRFKLGWNLRELSSQTIWLTDLSRKNFPERGYGIFQCPSSEITGGGIAVRDINKNGKPELFFMQIDNNPSAANVFRYTIAWDLTRSGEGSISFGEYSYPNFPGSDQGGAIGWETTGGGIDIGDIDNDGVNEIVFLGIESTTNTARFIIYEIDNAGQTEPWWRPFIQIPFDVSYPLGGAGVALADIDNDGDLDIVLMAVEKTPTADVFKIRFGINGRNSTSNNLFAKVQAEQSTARTTTEQEISSQYLLVQNYPNPFNPSTTISYQLPTDSRVHLKVFDLLGREVATVVDETEAAGYYQKRFDATRLSSGMYVYQVVATDKQGNRQVVRKKMLLLK